MKKETIELRRKKMTSKERLVILEKAKNVNFDRNLDEKIC